MEKAQRLRSFLVGSYKKMVRRQEGVSFFGLFGVLIYRTPAMGVVTSHLRVALLYGGSMRIPQIVPQWLVGLWVGRSVVPAVTAVTVTYCEPGNAEGAYQSWQGVGGTDPIKYLG